MTTPRKEREALKLKSHHCGGFEANIVIAKKDFLQDLFLEVLPFEDLAKAFKKNQSLAVSCGRSSEKVDYRAYVGIHWDREKLTKAAKLHFHVALEPTTAIKSEREQPPFAEDIFQWLHKFISPDASIELKEMAFFAFPRISYRSAFSLPLLLSGTLNTTENEIFEGAQAEGTFLNLQENKVGVSFAEQRVLRKSIFVRLNRQAKTTAQKLMTVEDDVVVLSEVALSTVRPIRRRK